jgi:hypothetical protein
MLEEGGDGAEDIQEISIESQHKICQPREVIAMKGLCCHIILLYVEWG